MNNSNGKNATRFKAGEYVREKILEGLKAGVAPWRTPWVETGLPHNAQSGRTYKGFNRLFLSLVAYTYGYNNSGWLTFNEVNKVGGTVRKGEHGTGIVYFQPKRVPERDSKGAPVFDDDGKMKMQQILISRFYRVWNVCQCEGLPEKFTEVVQFTHNPIEEAEAVVKGYATCPPIKFKHGSAFYSPKDDYVSIPPIADYEIGGEYYNTLFHEIGHSTGHASRLNRFGTDSQRDDITAYAFEELIAETVAATLCNMCGIEDTISTSTAYISAWIDRITNDKTLKGGKLLSAFSKADKAVAYIMGESNEGKAGDTTDAEDAA